MAYLSSLAVLAITFAAPEAVVYECLDGSRFTLTASPTQAVVRFSRPLQFNQTFTNFSHAAE